MDYVRLLAYSGARRRNEGLALRWEDVDFDNGQLTIGATGDTKNQTARVVDFNPNLKAHLLEMHKRRAQDYQIDIPIPPAPGRTRRAVGEFFFSGIEK